MRVSRYNETMLGLLDTARAKIEKKGFDGAKADLEKIGGMIEFLEDTWNKDDELTFASWTFEFQKLCAGAAEAE